MVIFLYGPDTYSSKQKLSKLKQKFSQQKDKQGLNISAIQAGDLSVDELRKFVLTGGLFAEKRLIIIEGILSKIETTPRRQTNGQQPSESLIQETINILKKSSAYFGKKTKDKNNIIIFWDREIKQKELTNSQQKLYQLLKKEKYAQEFKLLKPDQIKIWIKKETKKQGMEIEEKSVKFLMDICGNDLWTLKNELDKLAAASFSPDLPKRESVIYLENLKDIILSKTEQSIWQLTDALGRKNKALSLKLLSDQLRNGTSVDYLISMLAHQYRTIFRIKSHLETNRFSSLYQLANQLNLHPFVCQKVLEQEKNYTLGELKKIYQRLLEIDFLRKTRPINPEVLLDLLIVKNQ